MPLPHFNTANKALQDIQLAEIQVRNFTEAPRTLEYWPGIAPVAERVMMELENMRQVVRVTGYAK